MDFYRINEEYNKFLQRYEKEKKAGFKVIPHEHCGFGMRKIIYKSAMF